MARDEIRTRWHDWVAAYKREHLLIPNPAGTLEIFRKAVGFDPDGVRDIAEGLETLPHYFISPECLSFVDSDALTNSITALQKAGLEDIQHDHCVVEFERRGSDAAKSRTRYFVIVSRRDFPIQRAEHCYHPYICRVFMLYQPDYNGAKMTAMRNAVEQGRALPVDSSHDMPREWAVAPRASIMIRCIDIGFRDAKGVVVDDSGVHYTHMAAPWIRESGSIQLLDGHFQEEMTAAAGTAVRCLLGLMRTRGVDQVRVESPKLNKARVGRGKPRIVDHTVVRLGFYLDSSGRRHSYDHSARVPQTMHYRSAHTKRVWYGPRSDPKCRDQFIEGYVVNYVDGAPVPGPKPKVVRPPNLEGLQQ